MTDPKVFSIHKFNGQDYQLWKRQMEIYMADNKLMPYILGQIERPAQNPEAWLEKDYAAQAFLMRGLELTQLKYMTDCTTSAQMWARLKSVHAEKSDQSVQILLDRFINCKMDDDEKMADYIAKVTGLAQRLKDMDLEQKDPVIISKIIGSLPAKFDNIRTAWYTVSKADQTIEKLTDHLVNEEALLNSRAPTDNQSSEALATSVRRYSTKKFNKNIDKNSKGKFASNRKPGKCNYCQIPGHWARDCWKKKQSLQGTRGNESLIAKSMRENSYQLIEEIY